MLRAKNFRITKLSSQMRSAPYFGWNGWCSSKHFPPIWRKIGEYLLIVRCCTAAKTSMSRPSIQKIRYTLQKNIKQKENYSLFSAKKSTLFEQITPTREFPINSILFDVSFVFCRNLAFLPIILKIKTKWLGRLSWSIFHYQNKVWNPSPLWKCLKYLVNERKEEKKGTFLHIVCQH